MGPSFLQQNILEDERGIKKEKPMQAAHDKYQLTGFRQTASLEKQGCTKGGVFCFFLLGGMQNHTSTPLRRS